MNNDLTHYPITPPTGIVPSTARGIDAIQAPDQPASVVERIQLSDGYSASSEFFNEIRLHILGRLPGLQRDRRYTAKQLAAKEFWELLYGEQCMAGRCIAHMVCHGMLPLMFVEGRHEYPKRYRLK